MSNIPASDAALRASRAINDFRSAIGTNRDPVHIPKSVVKTTPPSPLTPAPAPAPVLPISSHAALALLTKRSQELEQELDHTRTAAEQTATTLAAAQQQILDLESALSSARTAATTAQDLATTTQHQLDAAHAAHAARVAELEARIASLEVDRTHLTHQIATTVADAQASAALTDVTRRLEAHQAQSAADLRTVQKERDEALAAVDKAREAVHVQHQAEAEAHARTERAEARTRAREAEATERVKSLEEALARAVAAQEGLREGLREARERSVAAETARGMAEAESARAHRRAESAEAAQAVLSHAHHRLQVRFAQLVGGDVLKKGDIGEDMEGKGGTNADLAPKTATTTTTTTTTHRVSREASPVPSSRLVISRRTGTPNRRRSSSNVRRSTSTPPRPPSQSLTRPTESALARTRGDGPEAPWRVSLRTSHGHDRDHSHEADAVEVRANREERVAAVARRRREALWDFQGRMEQALQQSLRSSAGRCGCGGPCTGCGAPGTRFAGPPTRVSSRGFTVPPSSTAVSRSTSASGSTRPASLAVGLASPPTVRSSSSAASMSALASRLTRGVGTGRLGSVGASWRHAEREAGSLLSALEAEYADLEVRYRTVSRRVTEGALGGGWKDGAGPDVPSSRELEDLMCAMELKTHQLAALRGALAL